MVGPGLECLLGYISKIDKDPKSIRFYFLLLKPLAWNKLFKINYVTGRFTCWQGLEKLNFSFYVNNIIDPYVFHRMPCRPNI
ncbi:hypothetical protein GCM10011339_10540 [Echinicola rosea]|uniref:Uncharacterized protein n=1 Tax=Echinicola rosea TaxID=1807691 RepID=A0ABQ1UPX8_9BACT|nr:hypothetical protein GCM10011339_10540 [Echinicola rosea]